METKQTAVEWLIERLEINNSVFRAGEFWNLIKNEAKQMEKEQIKNAFVKCWESNIPDGIECKLDAEEYYNETYNKTK